MIDLNSSKKEYLEELRLNKRLKTRCMPCGVQMEKRPPFSCKDTHYPDGYYICLKCGKLKGEKSK